MSKQLKRNFPFAHVGMWVHWHPDGNRSHPPSSALVTAINEQGVNVKVFEDFSDKGTHRECVRHLDDKTATPVHFEDAGGWAYTPSTHALVKLCPEFAEWPEDRPAKDKM